MKTNELARYEQRFKLKGYNCQVSVHGATGTRDAGRICTLLFPNFTPEEHQREALRHADRSSELRAAYSKAVDAVFMKHFGRKPTIFDYRITVVWRDDFEEADKEQLRSLGYPIDQHKRIAEAHAAAAKRLRRVAVRRLH